MDTCKEYCTTGCYYIGMCIYYIFYSIKLVIVTFCTALGYCWYPCKERCKDCCSGINRRRMNPQNDPSYPAYSTF